jgi:hypothetical protein
LHRLIGVSLESSDYRTIIKGFKILANVYEEKKEFDNAMKSYKNVLKFAWISQDIEVELKAYIKLSMEYFYMGKIDKSNAYHQKYMFGYLEPKDSSIRSLTMLRYQTERKNFESRKFKKLDYKLAASSSVGYVTKIKQILAEGEDRNINLAMYNYDEVFKVKSLPNVDGMDVRDLPSPTAKLTTNDLQKVEENDNKEEFKLEENLDANELKVCNSGSKLNTPNNLNQAFKHQIF